MVNIPDMIKKEIQSIDLKMFDLCQLKGVSDRNTINAIESIRIRNQCVIDFFANMFDGGSAPQYHKRRIGEHNLPSYMQKRSNSHPRCVRCREDYIKEKKERELAELKEISKSAQFKAKPPPPHIYPGNHRKRRF